MANPEEEEAEMTGLIIAIVVIAIIAFVLLAVVMPRARAKARERQLVRQRDEVATAHRERADDRAARAEYAEQQARRERAEADLHESRARLHERGLADDELDAERERLGTADTARDDGYVDDRDGRFTSDRDATVPPEERR
jgi:biopolymer transport protein ExbB/TolQ